MTTAHTLRLTDTEIQLLADALSALYMRGSQRVEVLEFLSRHHHFLVDAPEPTPEECR